MNCRKNKVDKSFLEELKRGWVFPMFYEGFYFDKFLVTADLLRLQDINTDIYLHGLFIAHPLVSKVPGSIVHDCKHMFSLDNIE